MKDNCKATNNSEKISKRLLDRDLTLFNEENTWINFRLKIRIQLLVESVNREDSKDTNHNEEKETTITLELTALHILVVLNDEDGIQNAMEKIIGFKPWLSVVQLTKPRNIKIAQENLWIKEANCFHLAAKFNPTALHLMLSKLKESEDGKNVFKNLYKEKQFSPLHVAAFNTNSLSLRYFDSKY